MGREGNGAEQDLGHSLVGEIGHSSNGWDKQTRSTDRQTDKQACVAYMDIERDLQRRMDGIAS